MVRITEKTEGRAASRPINQNQNRRFHMKKKTLRSCAAFLCGAALLASSAFAVELPAADTGDLGFNLEDFIASSGSAGPIKVYDAASGFADFASVKNQDAVTVLTDLGLFNGITEGENQVFRPQGTLTRGEMAKLAATAVTLLESGDLTGQATFTDTQGHWAADYIAFCADKGMMDGVGGGAFAPGETVTVGEFAKVLLAAMGETGLTGEGWLAAVQTAAEKVNLLDGITAKLDAPITRDETARLMLNAFTATDGTHTLPKVTLAQPGTYEALTIGEKELLVSPKGGVTLSVNGVGVALERGKTYQNVTVSVTEKNLFEYSSSYTYNYRQGIYADENGYDAAKSVSAVTQGTVGKTSAENVVIKSDEEAFNGIYVNGGTYTIKGADITLNGNGGNDFAGYGAAIAANGEDTVLIVDGANVDTNGAVRTTAVVNNGATLVVKNSTLIAEDGQLPADYEMTIQPGDMKESPWMLGIRGNNRATNLLGVNSVSAYINSTLKAENWGVLSSDNCTTGNIVTVNSDLAVTGERGGYVNLVIGSTTGTFLGSTMNSTDYGSYIMGGDVIYGDSTKEAVKELNDRLGLQLTEAELTALSERGTELNVGRNAVLQTGAGDITITGKAAVTTGETTFLIKGAHSNILVDGTKGATINAKNGVILQVMDSDDPGSITGAYVEPVGAVEKDTVHDINVMDNDVTATFIAMNLEGDFYNSVRGGQSGASMFSDGDNSKNLLVKLSGTTLKGVVSSSTAAHAASTINVENYRLLGRVTNTVSEAVNNGALVELTDGSSWTVTGTCCINALTISADSAVSAPAGKTLVMTVNGVETPIAAGQSYSGSIVLTVK